MLRRRKTYLFHMKQILLIPLATLTLAACQPDKPEPPVSKNQTVGQSSSKCDAANLQHLVGKSETALHMMNFAGDTRTIQHDSAVTMDHKPDRLNFVIGKDGKIARIYCG